MRTWAFAFCFLTAATTVAAEQPLWEIGKPDHDTAKFALGPNNYKDYRQPGFFVVGHSDPKKDWPYVQPGVVDGGWAPGKPQTFEIFFALAVAPPESCRLELHFADTHPRAPPRIRVEIDGERQAVRQRFQADRSQAGKPDVLTHEYQAPRGGGDASV